MVSKTSGVFLAFLYVSGVLGQDGWSVSYTPERICALKGSTVDIPCTYSYPSDNIVQKTVWFILDLNNEGEPEDLSENPQYRGRVQYLGNKNHDCSFRLTGLTESDSATYRFRFQTNTEGGKYTGQPGVTLTVTDLQVSVKLDTVTEGQRVRLTCRTTCTLTGSPAFIWYKNSKVINNENRMQYSFIITNSDDTDLYSCAIKGREDLPSPAVNVKCVRAEINSDTVREGQWVRLTCRTTCTHLSYSYSFRWYKNGQLQYETGRYLQFTASSGRAGRYSCDVWDGSKYVLSPAVTLKVLYFGIDAHSNPVRDKWNISLTCNIFYTHLTNRNTFTWYHNGLYLSNSSQELKFTTSSGAASRYSCAVRGYESLLSNEVTLREGCTNIQVKPEIVTEGESVTLTCITTCTHLGNSQAFTWYKNGEHVPNNKQYLQFRARRADSGSYSCAVQDGYNHLLSTAVTLSVNYPPKNTSVSVSPSGEIEEGSSVTLNCSSDANPPVHRYTWFKKTGAVTSERGTGESYTITNISSEDSGQYYCEAQNQHGALNSTAVTIDVQYAPKNISVSVSPSGEIEEGSSVTLTCSSDANPPVQNYTWFKKNESGVWLMGLGHSLNFSNFRSWNRGQYSCEAENKHGTHNATAPLVTLKGGQAGIFGAIGGAVAIVALVFPVVIVCMRRRNSIKGAEFRVESKEDNKSPVYDDISGMALSHTATQDTNRDDDDAALYSTVETANSSSQEETLYSNVQKSHPKSEDEVQYASIMFSKPNAAPRPAEPKVEDDCVLYSTVNKHKT